MVEEPGTFVCVGQWNEEEEVSGCVFSNISSICGDKGKYMKTIARRCRMMDNVVEKSMDSVHGLIITGVSGKTIDGFMRMNCSFNGIRRKKSVYYVGGMGDDSVEYANEEGCGMLSSGTISSEKPTSFCIQTNHSLIARIVMFTL